jgi:5-methylcytosine-specific restriction endonuclease McrA
MICNDCGTGKKLTKHHKKPIGKGGSNNKENIEILCRRCHDFRHFMDTYSGQKGYRWRRTTQKTSKTQEVKDGM